MTTLRVEQSSRLRRTRSLASGLSCTLPELRPRQMELLKDWLRSHAAERNWQSLLDEAGRERLDVADELLERLLLAGNVTAVESRENNQWLVKRVRWSDIAALQTAAGLRTAAAAKASREAIHDELQSIVEDTPWLESAARHCLETRLSDSVREARLTLLRALDAWHREQRFGLRRDFEQRARERTKSITLSEWKWLEEHVPLESLGIARFAPMLSVGGTLCLQNARGTISVAAAGMCALPMRLLSEQGLSVSEAPQRYWLIENRASFERQCADAPEGTCVLWLPGRPSDSWRDAVQQLLRLAPAPADISCDPDPAGVEIALTAGALWQEAQLDWRAHGMLHDAWKHAPHIELTAEDLKWLDRLDARSDLPPELRQLCAEMRQHRSKAEQEAWL